MLSPRPTIDAAPETQAAPATIPHPARTTTGGRNPPGGPNHRTRTGTTTGGSHPPSDQPGDTERALRRSVIPRSSTPTMRATSGLARAIRPRDGLPARATQRLAGPDQRLIRHQNRHRCRRRCHPIGWPAGLPPVLPPRLLCTRPRPTGRRLRNRAAPHPDAGRSTSATPRPCETGLRCAREWGLAGVPRGWHRHLPAWW